MSYLVEIQTNKIGADINSVSAKELHDFLGVKLHHSTWIKKRIKKYGFIENEDYIMIITKKEGNNAIMKEYFITLDMAKELSMVENNKKGREARKYFIEIEKKYRNQPQLIDGKDPHAIIRGLKSQLSQQKKKLELKDKNIDALIAENANRALSAPKVDLEPYKKEIQRLNDRVNKEFKRAEYFSQMAGVQIYKTISMFAIKDELRELQSKFLENPTLYNALGELVRKIEVIEKQTKENAEYFTFDKMELTLLE